VGFVRVTSDGGGDGEARDGQAASPATRRRSAVDPPSGRLRRSRYVRAASALHPPPARSARDRSSRGDAVRRRDSGTWPASCCAPASSPTSAPVHRQPRTNVAPRSPTGARGYRGVVTTSALRHRHGLFEHSHPYSGPHRHVRLAFQRSAPVVSRHDHDHAHGYGHGHSHGFVERSIVRSREGVKAVAISLGILGLTAFAQLAIFTLTSSVALLADLVHNFGDALTGIPLGIAFYVRSFRVEKVAGLAVVLAIFISACFALYETMQRFIHPEELTHLWVLAAAGVVGFVGNELAARVRLRAGRRLASPALVADGNHARTDGFVSLGVVVSAALVAIGLPRADPFVGLLITIAIFKITRDSWRLVSTTEPGETAEHDHHHHDHHDCEE
jgi:Co/Zn/Cd efflux system component